MRYIVFVLLLLGLVACGGESEVAKSTRENRERLQQLQERNRQFYENLQREQAQRQQWAPPPPQQAPQQVLVACPECRGSGKASRSLAADAWTENKCTYCNGHGTIVAGQGRRSRW